MVAQWERGRLLSSSRPSPYVGVRITPRHKDQARRQELTTTVSPARSSFTDTRTTSWPVWQYVTPPADGDPGVDPVVLATHVRSRLRELWKLTAPALDALHAGRHA